MIHYKLFLLQFRIKNNYVKDIVIDFGHKYNNLCAEGIFAHKSIDGNVKNENEIFSLERSLITFL